MKTQEILDEIAKLKKLQLKYTDLAGSGANASVYRCQLNNHKLAVKCFKNKEDAVKEHQILGDIRKCTLHCPGIVEYYGMKEIEIEITGAFNNIIFNYAIFIQECPMDLISYLKQAPPLKPKDVLEFLSQISIALTCMHANGCSHGDLKPSNIMVSQNNGKLVYYLTDFGESRAVEPQIAINYQTLTVRGTPYYFPPELWAIFTSMATHGKYGPQQADVYSIGIIALELLLGQQAIFSLNSARNSEKNFNSELEKIKKELLKIPEFQKEQTLVNMILKMISHKSGDRISAIQISQNLITANSFSIEGIEEKNLKTFASQLIQFQPTSGTNLKKIIMFLIMLSQDAIIQELQQSQVPTQTYEQINKDLLSNKLIFNSKLITIPIQQKIMLSLFDDIHISLNNIHYQAGFEELDRKLFHKDCDEKGSTLVIMHSNEEPNCFFGGMAVPQWESPAEGYKDGIDPADQCSWLFRMEMKQQQFLNIFSQFHQGHSASMEMHQEG